MNRYINSADALHTLKRLAYETALNQHDPYVADVFEDIAKNRLETWVDLIPTADVVERKHSKWIMHIDDLFPVESTMECSKCHHEQLLIIDDNFCPNCGADMKVSGD